MFDISPDGELLATGHDDGSIWVRPIPVPTTTTVVRADLHRHAILHKADTTALRFFPSSKVLLSASSDFSLRIISADDLATVPRTFIGHRRPITDVAIIDRGKNVLSCSKDGSLRLWDCSTGTQISMMGVESYSPIRKMDLGIRPEATIGNSDSGSHQTSTKPTEVGTGDKIVFCALQNGTVEVIDLASKSTILRSSHSNISTSTSGTGPRTRTGGPETSSSSNSRAPLSAVSYSLPTHMVATGSTNGIVTLYDIRSFSRPLSSFRRNGANIEDLRFLPPSSSSTSPSEGNEVRLAVATHDGLPFVASVRPEGPLVSEELVGYNCDPCRTIRFVGGALWLAGDDGIVRKY